MKTTVIFRSLLLLLPCLQSAAQEISLERNGFVDVYYVYGKPSGYVNVPAGKSFELKTRQRTTESGLHNLSSAVLRFRAWDILGDLVLHPTFIWSINQSSLTGRKHTVMYNQISKYPDLAKWYNNIKPSGFRAIVGMGLNPSDKYAGGAFAWFKLIDNDVLMETSGRSPYSVPTAPINWGERMIISTYNGPDGVSFVKDFSAFTNASKEHTQTMLKKLRQTVSVAQFAWTRIDQGQARKTTSDHAQTAIIELKWPLDDIDAIYERFLKYERGETSPTPKEQVANGVTDQQGFAGDEFWNGPMEAPFTVDLDNDLNGKTVTQGVINLQGKVTSPLKRDQGTIKAEGYSQPFDIGSNGSFSKQVVLKAGWNNIVLDFGVKKVTQRVYLDREPVDLRATLTWNTSGSDIDLSVEDPSGITCNYKSKNTGNMNLDVDNTRGYGPENILVKKVKKGRYDIRVNNFSGGSGTEATVYVYVNEILKDIHKVRFTSNKQTITVANYDF